MLIDMIILVYIRVIFIWDLNYGIFIVWYFEVVINILDVKFILFLLKKLFLIKKVVWKLVDVMNFVGI